MLGEGWLEKLLLELPLLGIVCWTLFEVEPDELDEL